MAATSPHLVFACELDPLPLRDLFADGKVTTQLQNLKAGIALGIRDFSPERKAVVQQLNATGIPVTAWLLLPLDQGYWFNLDNVNLACRRYEEFLAWTQQNGLKWSSIGLDIEPDIRVMQKPLSNLPALAKNLFNTRRLVNGTLRYGQLVNQIHLDGYSVDSYQFPFIVDERIAQSQFLRRLAGVVDLTVDREILMLYSSFTRTLSSGILWSYAAQADAVGIGVTGGGVDLGETTSSRPLDWQEFSYDLLQAYQFQDWIFIFSLEGCVQQDFLTQLSTFTWEQPLLPPVQAGRRVDNWRKIAQSALWLLSRPAWLFAGLFLGLWILKRQKHS